MNVDMSCYIVSLKWCVILVEEDVDGNNNMYVHVHLTVQGFLWKWQVWQWWTKTETHICWIQLLQILLGTKPVYFHFVALSCRYLEVHQSLIDNTLFNIKMASMSKLQYSCDSVVVYHQCRDDGWSQKYLFSQWYPLCMPQTFST